MNDMTEVPYWADRMPQNEPNAEGVAEHLGGHYGYTNMDTPTFDYLVKRFGIQSMVDIGCGPGGMVDYAKSRGLAAIGIDGDLNMMRDGIIIHDFTTGPFEIKADLIWCVEFVEHVEAKYVKNILDSFKGGKYLLLTHAIPGQGGKHHVNLQESSYWMRKLTHDWMLDHDATDYIRANTKIIPYISRTAMVWQRKAA
jgi:SAM-dependent methyltransferase